MTTDKRAAGRCFLIGLLTMAIGTGMIFGIEVAGIVIVIIGMIIFAAGIWG